MLLPTMQQHAVFLEMRDTILAEYDNDRNIMYETQQAMFI